MADNFQFNEKMKFSWGYIIAALALIGIAYCTFVGTVYLLKGQFLLSGIITVVVTLLIALLFYFPQHLRSNEHRLKKHIFWKRAFFISSPLLFILLMIPFSHAWTVHKRQHQILFSFGQIISASSEMFKEYETYSAIRIEDYKHLLETHNNKAETDSVTKVNKQTILNLALLSSNYDILKSTSQTWIDKSLSPNNSTWNVFLIGNITGIQKAIHNWHDYLQEFSKIKLSDEKNVYIFDHNNQYITAIDSNIKLLASRYFSTLGFNPIILIWLALGYVLLLLPYFLKSNHSKPDGNTITNKKKVSVIITAALLIGCGGLLVIKNLTSPPDRIAFTNQYTENIQQESGNLATVEEHELEWTFQLIQNRIDLLQQEYLITNEEGNACKYEFVNAYVPAFQSWCDKQLNMSVCKPETLNFMQQRIRDLANYDMISYDNIERLNNLEKRLNDYVIQLSQVRFNEVVLKRSLEL